jgi:hypothetical protein
MASSRSLISEFVGRLLLGLLSKILQCFVLYSELEDLY